MYTIYNKRTKTLPNNFLKDKYTRVPNVSYFTEVVNKLKPLTAVKLSKEEKELATLLMNLGIGLDGGNYIIGDFLIDPTYKPTEEHIQIVRDKVLFVSKTKTKYNKLTDEQISNVLTFLICKPELQVYKEEELDILYAFTNFSVGEIDDCVYCYYYLMLRFKDLTVEDIQLYFNAPILNLDVDQIIKRPSSRGVIEAVYHQAKKGVKINVNKTHRFS